MQITNRKLRIIPDLHLKILEITVKKLYHHANKQINKAGIIYLAIMQKYFHMIEDICHCIQHKAYHIHICIVCLREILLLCGM